MNLLEKEILTKIRFGDEKAFEFIFKSYYATLCTYAFDLLKNNALAEEVVQEILIRVWENRTKIDITVSVKSYLYKCVHNQCVNLIKHIQVIKNQSEKYLNDIQSNTEISSLTDNEFTLETFFYEGLEDDIETVILSLPEQCRKIFRMSRFEMLSHEEIAQRLDISVNTIKTQIRRALEKLKTSIGKKISEHADDLDILK